MMSSSWVSSLKREYSIEAIVAADIDRRGHVLLQCSCAVPRDPRPRFWWPINHSVKLNFWDPGQHAEGW